MRNCFLLLICCSILLGILTGCRGDIPFVHSDEEVLIPGDNKAPVTGFFLLNEGNMGSNKATIDFFNYEKNIFSSNSYYSNHFCILFRSGDRYSET